MLIELLCIINTLYIIIIIINRLGVIIKIEWKCSQLCGDGQLLHLTFAFDIGIRIRFCIWFLHARRYIERLHGR